MVNVRDVGRFENFLACVAARTGEELVYEDIASSVGVDSKTVKTWIGVLEATGIGRRRRLNVWRGLNEPVRGSIAHSSTCGLLMMQVLTGRVSEESRGASKTV